MKKFILTLLVIVTFTSLISINGFSESSAIEFRSIDGSGNNINNPTWGEANFQLLRMTSPAYNGASFSEPRGGLLTSSLPSARDVSNAVATQIGNVPDPDGVSNMAWQFGQFLDHDIDLTGGATPAEPFDIIVPCPDPFFDPLPCDNEVIGLNRSVFDPSTGTSDPRQQLNQITAYIDASNVYGSDAVRANDLRENLGSGKLRTSIASNGEVLLPFNTNGLPNAGGTGSSFFIAGDVRANEQAGLTAMHTLFVREHNRLAQDIGDRLAANEPALVQKRDQFLNDNPGLDQGDFIYEAARAVVGAQIQIITYEEFIPVLLGPGALTPYSGYDDLVNVQITNEFSTAAYRFGHTMISSLLHQLGGPSVPLATAFFNPLFLVNNGADGLLGAFGLFPAQKVDNLVDDSLRNFLFGPPGAGGFDLVSLNTQRGRDHGIASYNDVRTELPGISPAVDFLDMTGGDAVLAANFASTYTSIDDVDLWPGGLAELHHNGGLVGKTFFIILVDQFERLRDGDRFFYLAEGVLSHLEIFDPDLENTRLSDIIERNTIMVSMQNNMMKVPRSPVGGEMILVDTTTLMLAGTQYMAAWLIPVIVSAVGFGIVILRKI